MRPHSSASLLSVVCVLVFLASTTWAGSTDDLVKRGKDIYGQACAYCHGYEGEGNGTASRVLRVRPRDFTKGKFKIRTTPDGALPSDEDLYRTVTSGFPDYGMPSFDYLSEEERWALVNYVKSFSPFFKQFKPQPPIVLESSPSVTEELLAEGKDVYRNVAECNKCHGNDGRGNGPSADTLVDDWKRSIRPADFTRGARVFKRGAAPQDIVTTVLTGLAGTPMPSHQDVLTPRQAWAVAHYIVREWVQPSESPFPK